MKTYHIGLLQAHAYRVLKKYTKRYLAEYEIDDIEWSILGLLYSQESTPGDIADKLGVEIPFVNKVSNALLEKGFMKKVDRDTDRRTYYFQLTNSGKELVKAIEPKLRNQMLHLITPLSPNHLHGYIKTLEKIIKNSKTQ